jgi:spermidine synthase
MSNWFSYFYPQLVKTVKSSQNQTLSVYQYWGKYQLVAGGLTQSGGLVHELWQKAISEIKKPIPPKSALILGYGGGTIASILIRRWPKVKITGIDNDPVMVELGNRYLHTSTPDVGAPDTSGVDVRIVDAFEFMSKNTAHYDLIITDLYQGSKIPQKMFSDEFIKQIKSSLSHNGCALFNVFALKKHEPQAGEFVTLIKKYFSEVTKLHTISNWIIYTSNPGK